MDRRHLLLAATGVATALPSPAQAAKPKPGDILSVADFGVSPNAGADQSLELQRAFDQAAERGGHLFLPPGTYVAHDLRISAPLFLQGIAGMSRIVFGGGRTLLEILGAKSVTLSGIVFDGNGRALGASDTDALLLAASAQGFSVDTCAILDSRASGMVLDRCSGRILNCEIARADRTALFSNGGRGLEIRGNHVHDIGDNGIAVWQPDRREDGSIVCGNRIERIEARSGGSGPYGNGIAIFRAGSVMVSGNRVTDCAFSAVRNNSGADVQILSNSCERMGEVALYAEFAFNGAVISNNIVDGAAIGVSITNFDQDGRLAVCSGNLVRNLKPDADNGNTRGTGIYVEADTAVTGNVVENAPHAGLWLGWSWGLRNVAATGNVVRNCGIGITASLAEGAKDALIANNVISGSARGAILGMNYLTPVTGDLADARAVIPATLKVQGNLVTG